MLTKEQIQKSSDRPTKAVFIPQWGGDVHVRAMSAGQLAEFEAEVARLKNDPGGKRFRLLMTLQSVVTDSGELMFSQEDVAWLSEKNGAAIRTICEEAMVLNGMDSKSDREMEKNSPSAEADGSPTSSQDT